jgi:hypothetical protein
MAARNKAWTPDKVRERIKTSMLINRLSDHANGKVEMSATQVRAAEILLRKAVPDLSAVEHSGETTHRTVHELSREELLAIASGSRAGVAAADGSEREPAGIH